MGSEHLLRTHVDDNSDGRFPIYDYLKQDLLSLIITSPELNMKTLKHILKEVGSALHTLHPKGWIHLGTKTADLRPNNVLLGWQANEDGCRRIDHVVLAGLDRALQLDGNKLLNHRIGNVMWRSPEE